MRDGLPQDGPISTQLHSGRDLFLYGHARRPALDRSCGPHWHAAFGVPRGSRRTAICDRRHCGSPGASARRPYLANKRCGFSGRWRRIKGHFSSALIEAGLHLKRWPNGDLALWQRRFWEHTIRDDRDFARHIDYVHFNPVKHGLAQRVRDWPYSSFHRYVREGQLPEDWAGDVSEKEADFGEPAGGGSLP